MINLQYKEQAILYSEPMKSEKKKRIKRQSWKAGDLVHGKP